MLNKLRARVGDARDDFDGRKTHRKARGQLMDGGKKKKIRDDEVTSNLSNQQLLEQQQQEFEGSLRGM